MIIRNYKLLIRFIFRVFVEIQFHRVQLQHEKPQLYICQMSAKLRASPLALVLISVTPPPPPPHPILLWLSLSSSPQGLPGKDGETGSAGPPGPAVRISIAPMPLYIPSTLILSYPFSTSALRRSLCYLHFPDCFYDSSVWKKKSP